MKAFKLGVVLLVAIWGVAWIRTEAALDPLADDGLLEVVEDELVLKHVLSGNLAAERAVELGAPDAGIYPLQIRWMAENGAQVKPGETLIEFDNTQLVSNIEQREQSLEQALTDLASAESKAALDIGQAYFELQQKRADSEKAKIEADIPESLKAARDFEKLQLELRRTQLQTVEAERNLKAKKSTAQTEIEVKRLALGKAEGEIRRAERGMELLTLKAARAGVLVIQQNHQQGRPWQEGDSIFPGQRLARLPDLSTMIVRARLYDVDDGKVTPGMDATVTLDAFPDLPFQGRIRQIDKVALESGRYSLSRTFGVLVDLASVDLERMRPGMSAKVVVEERLPAHSDLRITVAPREGLDLDPERGPRALLADGSWVEVKLGPCNPSRCAVEAGLRAGDLLGRVAATGVSR